MEALIDALAPKRRGWTTKAVLLAVVAGAALAQCVPSPRGIAFEFVANARASCLGAIAVAAVRRGDVDGALSSLDSAEKTKNRSQETSRGLAIASEAVALELERRIPPGASPDLYTDALDAWYFAFVFAVHAGDADLQGEIKEKVRALNVKVVWGTAR